jgi:hypothetical protein
MIRVFFAFLMLAPMTGWCQAKSQIPAKSDANTVIVDLDQSAQYVYEEKIIGRPKFGSKPGEIGIGRDLLWTKLDDIAADDAGNIYIDDSVNHRVEKFDKDGKFAAIVSRYPNQAKVGILVDSGGHVFLNVWGENNNSLGVWEIWQGNVQKKYPGQSGIALLADGKIWFMRGSDKAKNYSSLDGKQHFIDDENVPQTEWPWRNGRRIIVSRPGPMRREVILPGTTAAQERKIIFQAKENIVWLKVMAAAEDRIFVWAVAKNASVIYEIHPDQLTVKSTLVTGSLDGAGHSFSSDGNIYSYRCDDKLGCDDQSADFKIVKATPVKGDK